MKLGLLFYRLGALGLLLTFGALWNEPMASDLQKGSASLPTVLILFGFAALAGFILLFLRKDWIVLGNRNWMYVTHGLSLLSILWLLLWCFVWLAIISAKGDNAEMFIKHTADLHLFGVGFTMAAYGAGWISQNIGERSLRFSMGAGWAISYMAWLNLYLQPGLKWLWAPAVGGLVLVFGAYLLARQVTPKP